MNSSSVELSLNEPAGVLVKTTCVDYPEHLAASFFLKKCNLRCPYCYNTGLIFENEPSENLSTIQQLFDHLEKRQGILYGLTISGGEPLLNPYTKIIIKKARSLGYKIKLDTNGTLPEQLKNLLLAAEFKPDFIAMDIKGTPLTYGTELCNPESTNFGNTIYFENQLKKSIELIKDYPANCREWRTVLVPGLIDKNAIKEIAQLLPKDASWQFAQFQNTNCLNPQFNNVTPYTDNEISELVEYAKTFIPGAALR